LIEALLALWMESGMGGEDEHGGTSTNFCVLNGKYLHSDLILIITNINILSTLLD
jgi:hypothetical protein